MGAAGLVSEYAGLALLITCASACIDYASARYFRAMEDKDVHRAGRWSVAQWLAASIGFVVAVKVTVWLLPFEAIGLYLGTVFGGQVRASPGVDQDMKTFNEITKTKCQTCHRVVAVVRVDDRETRDVSVVVSRHLKGEGLCKGSLAEFHREAR